VPNWGAIWKWTVINAQQFRFVQKAFKFCSFGPLLGFGLNNNLSVCSRQRNNQVLKRSPCNNSRPSLRVSPLRITSTKLNSAVTFRITAFARMAMRASLRTEWQTFDNQLSIRFKTAPCMLTVKPAAPQTDLASQLPEEGTFVVDFKLISRTPEVVSNMTKTTSLTKNSKLGAKM
jgi:hypothetical protein